MTASMPLRGPAAVLTHLLVTARASSLRISQSKLAMLLYLADLRAVERGMPACSGVEWRWAETGPRSLRLAEVERDLREAGVIDLEVAVDPYRGHREQVVHVRQAPELELDSDTAAATIDGVLADYGRLSAAQLRDLVLQTTPMRNAAAHGHVEGRLDLAGGPPLPDLGTALTRLRRWADEHPLPADDPGGVDDLIEESRQFADQRFEATRNLLDE